MKVKFIMAAMFFAGIFGTAAAQCPVHLEVGRSQESLSKIEAEDEVLTQNRERLDMQRSVAREVVCQIFKYQQVQAFDAPYKKKYEGDNFKLKVKKEKDGDTKYELKMDNQDLVWIYELDYDKGEVEVLEIFENEQFEYRFEKEGDEIFERLNGQSFNYLFDKDGNESTTTFASEDRFWTIEENN